MKNIILFDDENWNNLLPLSYTRPVSELRIGILTIKEKWERWLGGRVSYITQDYLSKAYPIHIEDDNYVINSSLLPNYKIIALIQNLLKNDSLLYNDEVIAARLDRSQFDRLVNNEALEDVSGIELSDKKAVVDLVRFPEDIFQKNSEELEKDFVLITRKRSSQEIPKWVQARSKENIFIEEGAKLDACTINAIDHPVYIGAGAHIMENVAIRGGLALCEGATLKMGAKIYGPTTIGPYSKVGGEVNNSVITGYSNKGHDGFLGNSVLGEWCNLGADTNNSNLKNNYSEVKLYDIANAKFRKTGTMFCGLIMGDHSKCGINTMFNTGTVVGVSANIFGSGYPRNYVPSFAWGGPNGGYMTYKVDKSIEVAKVVMARRKKELSAEQEAILNQVYTDTAADRRWEKK